jgi:hypothetical protein
MIEGYSNVVVVLYCVSAVVLGVVLRGCVALRGVVWCCGVSCCTCCVKDQQGCAMLPGVSLRGVWLHFISYPPFLLFFTPLSPLQAPCTHRIDNKIS